MDKRFTVAMVFSIAVVGLIAMLDILSMSSGVFGAPIDYENGNYTPGWWPLFKTIAITLIVIVPVCYYFFYKKDKSEAIALGLSSYALWRFGLADLFYFLFQGRWLPDSMPWLFNNCPIGSIAKFLQLSTVTPFSLILSIILGGIITYFVSKFLKDKF